MRGQILAYVADKEMGLIATAEGQRLSFRTADWMEVIPPERGMAVECVALDAHRASQVQLALPEPSTAAAPPAVNAPPPLALPPLGLTPRGLPSAARLARLLRLSLHTAAAQRGCWQRARQRRERSWRQAGPGRTAEQKAEAGLALTRVVLGVADNASLDVVRVMRAVVRALVRL